MLQCLMYNGGLIWCTLETADRLSYWLTEGAVNETIIQHQPHWQEQRHLDLGKDWQPCMPWIKGAGAKVLGPVGLPQLTDWQRHGVLWCLYALVLCTDLQGLHGHSVVFVLVVWGPGALGFCSGPLQGWPFGDQCALHCSGLTSDGQWSLWWWALQCRGPS